MKALVLATALVLTAPAAFAQAPAAPAAAAAVDPEKLKLAQQILESSGGAEAVRAQFDAMSKGMATMMKSLPSADPAMQKDLMDFMAAEQKKMVPEMLDATMRGYAQHLTTEELKAMLAWNTSPAAASIRAKMPAITQEVLAAQGPELRRFVRDMSTHIVDLVCEQQHCTADQKRQLNEIMAKQMGSQV